MVTSVKSNAREVMESHIRFVPGVMHVGRMKQALLVPDSGPMFIPLTNLAVQAREKADLSLLASRQPSEFTLRLDTNSSFISELVVVRPSYSQHEQCLPQDGDTDDMRRTTYRREDNEGPITDEWHDQSFVVDTETGELLADRSMKKGRSDASHRKRGSLPHKRKIFDKSCAAWGLALEDFVAQRNYEVTVREGDEVQILERPARSVSKGGIQYEWEGWSRVRVVESGIEGEVPTSYIMDVDRPFHSRRAGVEQHRAQSLDFPLPEPAQVIAGGHTSVSDYAAIARLSRQRVQYVSHQAPSPIIDSRRRPKVLKPWPELPQQSWRLEDVEPQALQTSQPAVPKSYQDVDDEDSETESGSDVLETRTADQLSRSDALFISYTISEDRTGGAGDFIATRLAALGALCNRRRDLCRETPRYNADFPIRSRGHQKAI